MPEPTWRKDVYGKERAALYIGGLYVGSIMQWKSVLHSDDKHNGMWRGWFMNDDEGDQVGWFPTADEARAAVERALTAALSQ